MADQPAADDETVYSMTAPRTRALPRRTGPVPVTVWAQQPGGIPEVIAKGTTDDLGHDGCGDIIITAADGARYASTQHAWDPTAHHWNSTARRLPDA